LDVHKDVGKAAGAAYRSARLEDGAQDMGDLVLSLSTKLTAFDFTETFVNAFDVGNKVVEILMSRGGIDVCCTDVTTLLERYKKHTAT
jgi:hypothetical protein